MAPRSKNSLIFKATVLLSITRWYNILLTVLAQYIAAFFVFNQWYDRWDILLDAKLHIIVLCTTIFIAAGYLINFYYDKEVDLINYPKRTRLFMVISKNFLLNTYVLFVGTGLLIAFIASFKIGLFFLGFSFLLWFYSHKLKRIPYVRELSATLLTIASFFSITLHYQVINTDMFLYGWFIFFIILIREGIKDQEQIKGKAVYSYYSTSIINNPKRFLQFLRLCTLLAFVPLVWFGINNGWAHYSLWIMSVIWLMLIMAVFILHKKLNPNYASIGNNLLKIAIVLSLLGLVWL
jgi:4-hydroxybenzoate polyprenyltransferase